MSFSLSSHVCTLQNASYEDEGQKHDSYDKRGLITPEQFKPSVSQVGGGYRPEERRRSYEEFHIEQNDNNTDPISQECGDKHVETSDDKSSSVTPIDERITSNDSDTTIDDHIRSNNDGMVLFRQNITYLQECHKTFPSIDEKMVADVNCAFGNPPPGQLPGMVQYVQDLPWKVGPLELNPPQSIKSLRRTLQLSTCKMVSFLEEIRNGPLRRCSYGHLIINKDKNKFLTVGNRGGRKCRSAPKGHIKMLKNRWETPLETAVRETNEEIHYWNARLKRYQTLNGRVLESYVAYLECVLDSQPANYRLIGLFVIILDSDLEFAAKDLREIDKVDWFGLDENIDPSDFYTVYPFVEYLRNHPEILSQSKNRPRW